MISSFFGKTKPITYIVLSVFIFLFYTAFFFLQSQGETEPDIILFELLTVSVLLISVYVISRIVKVEKVTELSSFAILFFTLLLVAFSEVLANKDVIFTNFFLLLAIWRLLAVKSIRNVKHKIFDATFLICIASLFLDWAVIFLILVFLVINVYDKKTVKNWIVPFAAIFSAFVLTFTILRLKDSLDFFERHYRFAMDFLNPGFLDSPNMWQTIVYVILMSAIMFLVFLKVRKKGGGKLVLLRIVFLAFGLGVLMVFFESGSSPLLITFFPAAVFLTNYLETIKKSKLKELIVGICIATSLLLFLLQLSL